MYPQVFGKYVLERELSRGGMARVVLATLRGAGGFEKKLVVKQIRDELAFDQQFVRRFVEEAKTTVALSHPNIVPVYELGVEQGTYFLAMELVEGVSVAELIKERNADGSRRVLTPEEGAYIGVEVCRALDYAHRRMKVVHRDITPRNVMIDEEGQIKLIDFGIAAPALVAGQEILGSPGHMAPEQVDGGELGPPTDIFAVAVLLMEAWTGSAPFRRATPEECTAAIRDVHPKPSDFDPRLLPLDGAISRAMDIDPKKRQQEASDLARELRAFIQGVDVADLARAIGDRVHDLREEVDSPSPPSRSTAPRSSAASHGDLGTKTFAARDESSWSNPPPADVAGPFDDDDDPDAPSTRKLQESSGRLPNARNIMRGRRDDPAMAIPTPLMVDIEELEKIHSDIDRSRSEKEREKQTPTATPISPLDAKITEKKQSDVSTVRRQKFEKPGIDTPVETIATRPFETPVTPIIPSPPPGSSSRTRSIGIGLALVTVLAIGAIAVWRTQVNAAKDVIHPMPTTTAPLVTSASAAPSSASSVALPPTTLAPSNKPPLQPPPLVPPSSNVPPTSSVPMISSAPLVQGRAAVMLLGDPGTRVSIDGASRGACPLRVDLSPGPHEVRFTFDPTGESRGERFTVKSGDRITVRADFTGATPTVKIQR